MQHFIVPFHAKPEANRADFQQHDHNEAEAKQRRKVQNRKNQRAHRLRTKKQSPDAQQKSRPFKTERWRLDEIEDISTKAAKSTTKFGAINTSNPIPEHALVPRRQHSSASAQAPTPLRPPPMIFSLSTGHLLHLVQYNVFRAFIANKRTLNVLLTGWTYDMPPSPNTCPISLPYVDDTNVYPLNPNIPAALFPTRTQQEYPQHSFWINLFPFPKLRDNLIRNEGRFDHWELLSDLIGELMGSAPMQGRQNPPLAITVSDPGAASAAPSNEIPPDEDGVTAGRRGLIVWGEPYDMRSWEATPGFIAKWSWAVQGCDDLLVSSNRWRMMRGEEPMGLPPLENLSLQ